MQRLTLLVALLVGTILATAKANRLMEPAGHAKEEEESQERQRGSAETWKSQQPGRFTRRINLPASNASGSGNNSNPASLMPEFSAPIGNVTAVLGRDVRLVCTVEHLGPYQVAWLKEESKTILSIDTNIITTNYRIFLIPDEEERKWVLHIKDVQGSDRGFYQCQVNTIPVRSTSGYLDVVVPPTIVEPQSSQVAEVMEHSNVTIQCKADGHPRPSISWRRDDGSPIRLNGATKLSPANQRLSESDSVVAFGPDNSQGPLISSLLDDVKSDRLSLYNVDRSMAGIYVCQASNGIPRQASKRIPLYVKFAPKTSVPNKYISISLHDQLEVDCLIEAFPKADSYWSGRPNRLAQVSPESRFKGSTASGASRWPQASTNVADRGAISMETKELIGQTSSLAPSSESQFAYVNETLTGAQVIKQSSDDNFPPSGQVNNNGQRHNRLSSGSKLLKPFALPQRNAAPANTGANHPHNRIHFRQVDSTGRLFGDDNKEDEMERSSSGTVAPTMRATVASKVAASGHPGDLQTTSAGDKEARAYVSVKQTAINAYTYQLRMTIARIQADDYGEYSCIASNSLGTSESHIIVTRADKVDERGETFANGRASTGSFDDTSSGEYQRDSLAESSGKSGANLVRAGSRRSSSSSGNHVVYDENYLQAIKTRQNAIAGSNRIQEQKLKLRQYPERNSAPGPPGHLLWPFLLITTLLAAGSSH